MKSHSLRAVVAVLFFVLMFQAASAHETRVYEIQGTSYEFVVGSLEEPLIVDSKNGVFLSVSTKDEYEDAKDHDHHTNTNPVLDLENTLRVELIAGIRKRSFNLEAMESAGNYKAEFIPTVETALTYRFFGEIDGVPIDLSFSCKPSHSFKAEEDTGVYLVSKNVFRTYKTGVFSCPEPGEGLMFPETKKSMNKLGNEADSSKPPVKESSNALVYLALALSLIGLLVSMVKRKK